MPSGFAEFVGDDFPVIHCKDEMILFSSTFFEFQNSFKNLAPEYFAISFLIRV
jgi:hypothetical protein